jgi:molybdenum cofactor cytidylyltransferase
VNSSLIKAKIAAVIIAAGESRRFKGIIKQLVPWKNKPLILNVIHLAIENGLAPIVVVLGANSEQINPIIKKLPIKIIKNEKWKEGKGTSISMGISSLPKIISAAMIFVVDQPFLSTEIIQTIIKSSNEGDTVDIIAPYVGEIQANPVLFKNNTFADLNGLMNEQGGKDIFRNFRVGKIQWADKNILTDIDTIEDYLSVSSSSNLPV